MSVIIITYVVIILIHTCLAYSIPKPHFIVLNPRGFQVSIPGNLIVLSLRYFFDTNKKWHNERILLHRRIGQSLVHFSWEKKPQLPWNTTGNNSRWSFRAYRWCLDVHQHQHWDQWHGRIALLDSCTKRCQGISFVRSAVYSKWWRHKHEPIWFLCNVLCLIFRSFCQL